VRLTFCGAAGEVTGSCYLFEAAGARFLVDCGMFQGGRELAERNHAPWPFEPRSIDFVVLTHAHIDHSGLLPKLVRDGFRGPIHMTAATRDLIAVLLEDSARLQAADAERAARHGRERRGRPVEPLYSDVDVARTLELVDVLPYDHERDLRRGVRVCLRDAGHILGSAIVELWLTEAGTTTKVVASGDLGQPGRPILRDPATIESADVLLVESTYGNRDHKPLGPTLDELVATVERTLREKKGNVIVPAFAVGRTQELLYWFEQLTADGRLGELDVFVDSPMAAEVNAITARHFELFDEEARSLVARQRRDGSRVRLHETKSVQDSMALNRVTGGAVILAASGMCDGGRVRHHLRHHLPSPRTTVLFCGYQAVGTLGRRLVDRAPVVQILGEEVPVRAEIVTLGGFSAHAGQSALLDWLGAFRTRPATTFLVHGEADVADEFGRTIEARLGGRTRRPAIGDVVDLREAATPAG
jgi:metallo-beta-lactamase family protein